MATKVRIGGPLGQYRDGVEEALRELKYSEGRIDHLLLLVAHVSRWLDEHGSDVGDLTDETVEQFFVEFRAHHRWCRSSKSLAPVLSYLRVIGLVPPAEIEPAMQSAGEELLASFQRYLRDQRGLSESTIEAYRELRQDLPASVVAGRPGRPRGTRCR